MSKKIIRILQVFLLSAAVISALLSMQIVIQLNNNKDRAVQTSIVLLNQVESIVTKNTETLQSLMINFKDLCVSKAQTVSYILDYNPSAEKSVTELVKIAELVQVDEIHLFDESGKIIGGSVPKYYGYSFDSGEQMAYFKPMLTDKRKQMCQDPTPNTAESKTMMYAIIWRNDGSGMLQIGIEPVRLLEYLRSNDIKLIIDNMPTYDGVDIIVADQKTKTINGTTIPYFLYKDLESVGIDVFRMQTDKINHFITKIYNKKMYCTLHEHDKYYIAIVQDYALVNQSVIFTVFVVFVYLFLAALFIIYIVRRMTLRIIKEEERANRDKMTGLLNRQAYETAITEKSQLVPPENDFVFLMADLNGLKNTNDTLGHGAGDELLQGAAECLKHCLGAYGDIYRIGGDEFVAMMYVDSDILSKLQKNLIDAQKKWTGTLVQNLSLSCGYVEKHEFPNMTLAELIKIADKRMYIAKKEYYAHFGTDRRHSF